MFEVFLKIYGRQTEIYDFLNSFDFISAKTKRSIRKECKNRAKRFFASCRNFFNIECKKPLRFVLQKTASLYFCTPEKKFSLALVLHWGKAFRSGIRKVF
ncbi:Uncharacterized protein dnm_074990 [Desulfonema magnum]|uniref:Uncharacterized protein n=1 Tax=Desulfonema magnum TaxID=45655 RepID=A0A975BU92_9BACT|nr:Uncharacterized protein dnm_074990 [Desulfonema magnum]